MRRDDGHPRMDITSFVGKLLEEDHVDLLREGVQCSPSHRWRPRSTLVPSVVL
jgi:hypothetical protein